MRIAEVESPAADPAQVAGFPKPVGGEIDEPAAKSTGHQSGRWHVSVGGPGFGAAHVAAQRSKAQEQAGEAERDGGRA